MGLITPRGSRSILRAERKSRIAYARVMEDVPDGGSGRALLIARFRGNVDELLRAYDRAHRTIMDAGGPPGELRHHCAVDDDSLYLVGLWESEEVLRSRFASEAFRSALAGAGFPPIEDAEVTVLRVHAIEPPL